MEDVEGATQAALGSGEGSEQSDDDQQQPGSKRKRSAPFQWKKHPELERLALAMIAEKTLEAWGGEEAAWRELSRRVDARNAAQPEAPISMGGVTAQQIRNKFYNKGSKQRGGRQRRGAGRGAGSGSAASAVHLADTSGTECSGSSQQQQGMEGRAASGSTDLRRVAVMRAAQQQQPIRATPMLAASAGEEPSTSCPGLALPAYDPAPSKKAAKQLLRATRDFGQKHPEAQVFLYIQLANDEGLAYSSGHTFSSPTVYDDLVNATCAIDALYRGSSRSKMEPAQDEGVGYRPRSLNPDPISGFNEYCWGEGQKEKWREQCGAGATAPQLTKAASVAWERLGPAARQEWRDKAAARKQLSAGSHGGGAAMPSTTADESEGALAAC
ncbi:hypothetical protein ABPG75_001580 [Micractinium tetrahymenae]